METDEMKCIDNSTLESLHKCSVKVVMDRVFGYRPKKGNHYLDSGTAIHAGIEHFCKNGTQGVGDVVRNSSAHLPFEVEDLPPAYHPDNLAKLTQIIVDRYAINGLPWKVVWAEKAFRVKLTEDIWINGKCDIFAQEQSGAYAEIDVKTTGRMDSLWAKKQQNSSQRSHYIYSLRRLFGEQVWMSYVWGIEVKQVPGSNVKCKVHGVKYAECGSEHVKTEILPVQIWPARIDKWYVDAVAGAKRFFQLKEWVGGDLEKVQALPMEGVFNGNCYNCEYQEFCHFYNRKAEMAEQLFKIEHFNPEEGCEVLVEGKM